ncbi:hypothetical protein Poli38472_012152 [Pythium oligandrum]|uniref:WW domain-containing protein n=1 Tax=Pythium oligandrum TaxID=41045 RepID=A0A8K1FLE1_PYTOL|nr:hypothetical protein Poli38472_012152 [Pythium oligandrum]|eukprot:TMW67036.1 hypothetical protein Poli38472_012152 [Pythium oligandrum]
MEPSDSDAEPRALGVLRRAMRSNEHWRPTVVLAKCLGVTHQKLQLTQRKDDPANLVWTTVLVLVFCTERLADTHELWYEMAQAATTWLYLQPHFVENRDDLVHSACALLGIRDAASLLATVFPEPKDEETLALEAVLGDWKICYLEQPPYTMYYWNEKTNVSTWRNPIETAKLEKERLEALERRKALLAKALPQRLVINRDRYVAPEIPLCHSCEKEADILCLACDSTYFCAECCDIAHCNRMKVSHIEQSFRYKECLGIKGFPVKKEQTI